MKCRKSTKTTPRAAKNNPKRSPRRPKTTPRGAQDDQKSDPERQDEKRTEPRRSWDRLGPPRCRFAHYPCAPRSPFGRPKRHQNRAQNDQKSKRKFKTKKRRPKTILDTSWSDLGPILGSIWAKNHRKTSYFVTNHFFDEKTTRRRFRDQLGPKKAPT